MAERSLNRKYEVLLIGGSAGSLEVLLQILPNLRKDFGLAVIVVLHRKAAESVLADLLNNKTALNVKEAEEKEKILPNHVYLAPADYHLIIEKDKTFTLDYSEKVHYSRPAIDVTFETAADAYGPKAMAVLLTGANADGTEGLKQIKQAGGYTIVQDPKEAAMAFMPQSAINTMLVDKIGSVREIISFITEPLA